ncbi:MAG: DUF2721 domain-containing protein [Planctomycetota bacterium]
MGLLDATLIELLVAPAVLIPACGLLAMSTSARLSAILVRVRDLHRQRLESYVLHTEDDERANRVREIRLEGLEVQAHWLIRGAAMTRASLLLIYASIAALLLSSTGLGIAVAWAPAEYAALGFFALGLLILLAAVIVAMLDVRQSLRWVRYEHDRVARLADRHDKP